MLLFVKGKCLFDLHVNTVWQHTIKEPNVIIQDNFETLEGNTLQFNTIHLCIKYTKTKSDQLFNHMHRLSFKFHP